MAWPEPQRRHGMVEARNPRQLFCLLWNALMLSYAYYLKFSFVVKPWSHIKQAQFVNFESTTKKKNYSREWLFEHKQPTSVLLSTSGPNFRKKARWKSVDFITKINFTSHKTKFTYETYCVLDSSCVVFSYGTIILSK